MGRRSSIYGKVGILDMVRSCGYGKKGLSGYMVRRGFVYGKKEL